MRPNEDASPFLRACRSLPRGQLLPDQVWHGRHRGIVRLLWIVVPALALFGLARGVPLAHGALELLPIAALAGVSGLEWLGRRVRATAASFALITACAVLVHVWEGRIEAHFAFFVVVTLLVLYQDWLPFLLAIGYVIVHHGLLGALAPASVYDHPGGVNQPWVWAFVHGGFVLAACAANLVSWRANEQLLHVRMEADTDELTGLLNRRAFYRELEHGLEDASVEDRPLGLLLLDLDRFKEVNDTLGHHAGDELLRTVGERLRAALPEATLGRLGGDEFVAVVRADGDGPLHASQRILDALEQPVAVADMITRIGGSIGVACFPAHARSRAELMRYADMAMYRAKRNGSGAEQYVPEDERPARERLTLAAELRGGIAGDQLVLHYQPKADLATGGICGAEALVRWQHPVRGLLPPDAFIELAEAQGMMRCFTLQVLRLAFRDMVARGRAGLDLALAVNLSSANLLDRRFPGDVAGLIDEYGVDAGAIRLEVTESTVMADPARVLDTLARLSELGLSFALDDFGTGYSSLAQLRRLPVAEIKIDRSFVLGMTSSDEDATIVRSTVELARNLGLRVVAEGVETQAHWDELAACGCHEAQGYHISRPLPSDAFTAWLRARGGASPASDAAAS